MVNFFLTQYRKYREIILYVVAGGCTTALIFLVFWLCRRCFGLGLQVSVVSAWFLAVLFAFAVNKLVVFSSRGRALRRSFAELCGFFGCRLASMGAEMLIMDLTVTRAGFGEPVMKIAATVAVDALNFIASKYLIFRSGSCGSAPAESGGEP